MKHKARIDGLEKRIPARGSKIVYMRCPAYPGEQPDDDPDALNFGGPGYPWSKTDDEPETVIAWAPLTRQHHANVIAAKTREIEAAGGFVSDEYHENAKPGEHVISMLTIASDHEGMITWCARNRDMDVFDERKYAAEVAMARGWATAHGWEYEPDVDPVTSSVDM